MLNDKVGKSLKLLRMMNDYSQEEVEIAVDISRSTLSKIENGSGKIDLERLERFAKLFKVEVITILTMSNKKTDYVEKDSKVPAEEDEIDYRKTDVELARSKEKVNSLKKEITYLKQEVTNYKLQLKDKQTIIELMNRQ